MTRLWFALFMAMTSAASAQAVRVTSGEHDGFTRLVFDYGEVVDWQMGRASDGYELRLAGKAPSYDLTKTFALIGKSRLAALWAAPDTGNLHIGLACACHAIPFEFRPGIVVVDLKDGPPPKGSSFELALDGMPAPPIDAPAQLRPKRRVETVAPQASVPAEFNWIEANNSLSPDRPAAPRPSQSAPAVLPPDPGLQPLRDSLMQQMARGASQGVVDMASLPKDSPPMAEGRFPSAQIRIGPAPTSVNQSPGSAQGDLGATGTACLPASSFDFATWGDDTQPFVDQMATARSGLSGEFDKPEPDAVLRAVRFQLFLGFGAEARQMLQAFDFDSKERKTLDALGRLLDGLGDPNGTFQGQAACSGPVALWSLVADKTLRVGDPINSAAVRLAFSALPLHLRKQIGPELADRFLTFGDKDSARAIHDAIVRAPGQSEAAVSLIAAELELQSGEAAKAEHTATEVIAETGQDQPEALIALIDARIAQTLPVSADIAFRLRTHLSEHTGSALEPRIEQALVLADAASGNFGAAFDGLESTPEQGAKVWSLLLALAEDEVFLTYAVIDPTTAKPELEDEIAAGIARRLVGLGLPASAKVWLANVKAPDPLLVAETELKDRNAIAALAALEGATGELASALEMQALEVLGEEELRATLLENTGDLAAISAGQARAGSWDLLAEKGDAPWKTLADKVKETPAPVQTEDGLPYGALARGHDLIAAGTDTRSAIDALLAVLPSPPTNMQNPAQEKNSDPVPIN